jgi:two-component system sensor histidine kinase RpfC
MQPIIEPAITGRRYHATALTISCVVIGYMATQFIWQPPSPDQMATVTLASYYTLIRMIQLITIRKPFHLPLHPHGPLVILDQIYLAVMAFSGLPALLMLFLSGLLLFTTRALGERYVFIAMPVAFVSIFVSLTSFSLLQLDTLTAIALSLFTVLAASIRSTLPLAKVAMEKYRHAKTDHPEQGETLDSEEIAQDETDQTLALDNQGPRILIISNNDKRLELISQHFTEWDYDYTVSRNCVQAFRHMLSRYQVDRFVTYTTLIVDQHGLDLDPISLAQLIKDEATLEEVRLICFKCPTARYQQSQQLIQAGYDALIDSPLDKAQLFNALHDIEQQYPDDANVVSLSEHREHKSSNSKPGIILLADAASSERTNLSKILIQAGYQVRMVDDGDQALDALEELPINLAIVNIRLSVMSGTQVLKLHRFTTPHKQWVPFLFLSDENNTDAFQLCRSIGVHACLFKPVAENDLLEVIPTLLSQKLASVSSQERYNALTDKSATSQLSNANLLDHMTLLRLERLDSGIAFINDLFKIFEAEGSVVLRTMHQAVESKQFGLFLDQAQILLDSAGQLGAFTLYELNRNATKIRADEFEYRGHELLEEIEKTFYLTLQAYSHYLSQRAAALQKNRV